MTIDYDLSDLVLAYCQKHAQRMADGAATYSFKSGTLQNADAYLVGKIGEWAFAKFCDEQNILVRHMPFRGSYQRFDPRDDFIVEIDSRPIQVEVRTKLRTVNPQPDYNCCTDCIKAGMVYVFVSYNKSAQRVSLVGFADPELLRRFCGLTVVGSTNCNFTNTSNEWNVRIEQLYPMESFVSQLMTGSSVPVCPDRLVRNSVNGGTA